MADQTRSYKIRYSADDQATGKINALGAALVTGSTRIEKFRSDVSSLTQGLVYLGTQATYAAEEITGLNQALNGLPKNAGSTAATISGAFGRIEFNAGSAARSVQGINAALGETAGKAGGINQLQGALQSAQRTTYGFMKNAQEANLELGKVVANTGGINSLASATSGLEINLRETGSTTRETGTSFGGLMAAMMALQAADSVVTAIGESIRSAREDTEGWANDALKLRNELRELANLQGKPGADDEVVRRHLGLRVETGMSNAEARKFDEQFRGSLPLSKDAGGIDDATASKMSVEVGKMAVRTGLDGGTAGDLAGSLGMFGAIPDAEVGLGRSQQIVDLLNDGRGNLTPLVKELMKDAAATTGEGKMFRTLQERAAAISTSTGLGAIGRSSTRINQAIAGLSGFDKEQGEQLELHGIKDTDDFVTRIKKIAPLVRYARREGKDPLGYLQENGFKNQVEAKAIVGFVDNLDALERRTESVREDPGAPNAKAREAGKRSDRLNNQFLSTDKAARDRVASAKLEAEQLRRGKDQENLQIERKEAEARLQARREIDTPETNFRDQVVGGFGLAEKLGAPGGRQQRIDNEIKRKAVEELGKQLGRAPTREEQADIDSKGPSFAADYLSRRRTDLNRVAEGAKINPGRVGVPGQPQGNQAVAPQKKDADGEGTVLAAPKGGFQGKTVGNSQVVDAIKELTDVVRKSQEKSILTSKIPPDIYPYRR